MKKSFLSKLVIFMYLLFGSGALTAVGYSSWSILNGGAGGVAKNVCTPPVAYYTYNSQTKYFPTIEGAVASATDESKTVGIEVKALVSAKEITISKSFTIPSNITLTLPYSDTESDSSVLYKVITTDSLRGTAGYDSVTLHPDPSVANIYNFYSKNRTLKIVVNGGVQITNYGKLLIGGIQSGSNGGSIAGFATTFAEINLLKGASIDNYGTFVNFGYVVGTDTKETARNGNTTEENEVASVVQEPGSVTYGQFVVVEHRGGTVFSGLSSVKGSPFNRFFFPSFINAIVKYKGADSDNGCARFIACPDLYAGSQHNRDKISIIGSSGIIAPGDGFSLTSLLTFEDSDGKSDINKGTLPKHYLDTYGSFNLNSMSITIDTGLLGTVSLSTSSCYFPLSCYYDVELHKSQNNSSQSIVTSSSQKLKVLPGSRLVIGESVSASFPGLVNYAKYDKAKYDAKTGEDSDIQGKSGAISYEKMNEDGTLINDGTLAATEFGGFITSRQSDAKFSFTSNSVTTYEVSSSGSFYSFDVAASGYVDSDTALADPMAADSYKFSGSHWEIYRVYSLSFICPSDTSSSDQVSYTVEVNGKTYSDQKETLTIDNLEAGSKFKIITIANGYLPSGYSLSTEYSLTQNTNVSINKCETLTKFDVIVATPSNANSVNITLTFKKDGAEVCKIGSITKTTYLSNNQISNIKTGMTMRFSSNNIKEATFLGANVSKDTDYLITNKECTLNITPTSCLISGTLVTMADGSKKPVDDIVLGDTLRTWDFESGSFSTQPVILIEKSDALSQYFDLLLDNGTRLGVAWGQAFFDMDERDYIKIYDSDAESYIGRNIMIEGDNGPASARIIGVEHVEKAITVYELITAYDYNYFANGVMTATPLIPDHTFFNIDSGLKYDETSKASDIAKYGLYRYEEFADYFSESLFELINGKYWKIAVGKGYCTEKEMEWIIQMFLRYEHA